MLFSKWLASCYLISLSGWEIITENLSGTHNTEEFPPHFTQRRESSQLENRQIWVKFLIAYFIFAYVILVHTFPESFQRNL